ncbi:MAG: PRC-barrel domain-containing protein [Methylophilaceae bacterium]
MLLSATSLIGDEIQNISGEALGKIEDLMIDVNNGDVKYAVLTFGGFLGMGNKLFAVPLEILALKADDKCFVMNISKEKLENAPGFDKDDWPNTADLNWQESIYNFYRI